MPQTPSCLVLSCFLHRSRLSTPPRPNDFDCLATKEWSRRGVLVYVTLARRRPKGFGAPALTSSELRDTAAVRPPCRGFQAASHPFAGTRPAHCPASPGGVVQSTGTLLPASGLGFWCFFTAIPRESIAERARGRVACIVRRTAQQQTCEDGTRTCRSSVGNAGLNNALLNRAGYSSCPAIARSSCTKWSVNWGEISVPRLFWVFVPSAGRGALYRAPSVGTIAGACSALALA